MLPANPRDLRIVTGDDPDAFIQARNDVLAGASAGEIVGGLYFHNYGSGTGLVAGVTFGRIAGGGAAAWAKR